jgi:ubiquinol-cytochrome c reductase iron-sulfur subunit
MRLNAKAGGKPQNGPGVLRNIRLKKRDAHGFEQSKRQTIFAEIRHVQTGDEHAFHASADTVPTHLRFVGRGVNKRQREGFTRVTTIASTEPTRRDFLYIATSAAAAVGTAAVAWPLISQMNPDASTIAAGAPIEVDLTPIAEGQVIKVFWRSKPIFINHRTKKQIEEAQNVDVAKLPDPQPDSARVKAGHDQWQVLIAICTHLGCIPLADQGPYDGYFCPCHGSVYDTSGRIRQGPAPLNLALPPYEFISDSKIRIG